MSAGRQRFACREPRQGLRRIGFAGQQHGRAPLAHVPNEAIAGAAGDDDLDAVERVRPVVAKMMRQLLFSSVRPYAAQAGRAPPDALKVV